MFSGNENFQGYPEWYRIERETEKTIKKLTSVKELTYYLANPDEYIRRLAILRLSELKLKDSINILKELLDDPLESSGNKELTAWAIKSISLKCGLELFLSGKPLSKYSGNEKYGDLYRIYIVDSLPSIKFDFSSALANSEMQMENSDIRRTEDINFDMSFTFADWSKAFLSSLSANMKTRLAVLPALLLSSLKTVLLFTFVSVPKRAANTLAKCYKGRKSTKKAKDAYEPYYGGFTRKKAPLTAFLKKLAIGILRFIFTPVRLVIRHKKLAFSTLLALYCLLTFTVPGKNIAYRYLGQDFVQIQADAYYTAREVAKFAWSELKQIAGINEMDVQAEAAEVTAPAQPRLAEKMVVTAKTGLNMRKEPDADSKKVSEKILSFNTTVTYLSKSQKDKYGKLWHYIQAPDGKTGWAYSKWLKEIGGGENAGQ